MERVNIYFVVLMQVVHWLMSAGVLAFVFIAIFNEEPAISHPFVIYTFGAIAMGFGLGVYFARWRKKG